MGHTVTHLCQSHGISRQAYYKHQKAEGRRVIREDLVVELVRQARKQQPMIGGKKLYHLHRSTFRRIDGGIGRDRLFAILRKYGLLVQRKRRYVRTTQSYHRFRLYRNLIRDVRIHRPNQVFVSDITYLSFSDRFCYLSLITDVYSRKIVGYQLSRSLSIEGSVKALKMALKQVPCSDGLIHHSDRGIQYCSRPYTELLKGHGVQISMTEQNHVYENALAERVNGILKTEYLLDSPFRSYEQARQAVDEAIKTYNEKRPHMSIGMEIPAQRYAA